ncbi:hypothetical protein BH10PSE7_BH10PSE7_15460 [soil metagenome]
MRAGELDRRVDVQERTVTQGDVGENVESWSTVRTQWMGKRDVRAAERLKGNGELAAEIDTVFKARYLPGRDIAPDTHRLLYGGRVYQIHGVTELGRGEAIEITCQARGEAL